MKIIKIPIKEDETNRRYIPLCLYSFHVGVIRRRYEDVCIGRDCRYLRRVYLDTLEQKCLNTIHPSIIYGKHNDKS